MSWYVYAWQNDRHVIECTCDICAICLYSCGRLVHTYDGNCKYSCLVTVIVRHLHLTHPCMYCFYMFHFWYCVNGKWYLYAIFCRHLRAYVLWMLCFCLVCGNIVDFLQLYVSFNKMLYIYCYTCITYNDIK